MNLATPQTQQTPTTFATRRPAALIKYAGIFALLPLLVAVVLLINTDSPFFQPLDDAWRAFIGASPESTFYLTPLPMFFQHLGEALGALAFLIAAVAFAVCGRWRTGLFIFVAFLGSVGAVSQAFKHLVSRARPADDSANNLFGPLFDTDHGSFPSGHSVTAGVAVIILLALIPASWSWARKAWPVVCAFITLGMMWQRTLINAHWLSDTLSGVCLGVACGLLFWWLFYPGLRKEQGKTPWFLSRKTR